MSVLQRTFVELLEYPSNRALCSYQEGPCPVYVDYDSQSSADPSSSSSAAAINGWGIEEFPPLIPTLTQIPETSAMLKECQLPLGLVVRPFGKQPRLTISGNIARCRVCKAYLNAFVTFVERYRWQCNLCRHINNAPADFEPISPDDHTHVGMRPGYFDRIVNDQSFQGPNSKPFLLTQSLQYISSVDEYVGKPPVPAIYVFLLDVSKDALNKTNSATHILFTHQKKKNSHHTLLAGGLLLPFLFDAESFLIKTGYLSSVCELLSGELSALPGDRRKKLSIIAFDSSLHFFRFYHGQFERLVVSDLPDGDSIDSNQFIPFPDDLLYNVSENEASIRALLSSIPRIFEAASEKNAAGAAILSALNLIRYWGGRVSLFVANDPTMGEGAFKSTSTGHTCAPFKSSSDFFKRLSLACADAQVTVDIFKVAYDVGHHFFDLSLLAKYSGGQVYDGRVGSERFNAHFRHYLTRPIGFETVIRIRCSHGLEISSFFGDFFVRATDLVSSPIVHADTCFAVQLAIDEDLTQFEFASFQLALLYTSPTGERVIRVSTIACPIARRLDQVLEGSNIPVISALIARMAVDRAFVKDLEAAREGFTNVATGLEGFTNFPSKLSKLDLLTLNMFGLMKTKLFTSRPKISVDERIVNAFTVLNAFTSIIARFAYPELYQIFIQIGHDQKSVQTIYISQRLGLTKKNIEYNSAGIYALLTYDGTAFIIATGQYVDHNVLRIALNCPTYENGIDISSNANPIVNFIGNAYEQCLQYEAKPTVLLVTLPNSQLYRTVSEYLVDDSTEDSLSFHEFLMFIQKQNAR